MAERLISVPAARSHVEVAIADPILKATVNNVLDGLPAVDAVPVVRCKACAKREQEDMFYKCVPCGYKCNDGEWFCPAGIRRDEGES